MQAVNDTSLISRINALLGEVDSVKQAAVNKQASEMSTSGSGGKDPGGYQGASTHPSAKADNMTQSAPLGFRARENEEDVKKDHPGAGVDHTSPGSGGDQDSHQYNIGTVQSSTGEQPSVEDDYKGDKDDPGTTHPANADEVGEKYASMPLRPLLKLAFDKMNSVLADIANGNHLTYYRNVLGNLQQKQAGVASNGHTSEAALAARAGYEVADNVLSQDYVEKVAAAQAIIAQTIQDGETDADNVGQFLQMFRGHKQAALQALHKRAMDPAAGAEGEDHIPPELAASGAAPPGGAPGGGPPGMPPGMPPGGGPDMGAPPGGPPGMSPDGGGGAPEGGAGDHEAAINELFNALAQMGIPPEELLAAAQHGSGGGGGGEAGAKAAAQLTPLARHMSSSLSRNRDTAVQIYKLAHDCCSLMVNGRVRVRRVEPGTKEAQERAEIIDYIKDVCGLR